MRKIFLFLSLLFLFCKVPAQSTDNWNIGVQLWTFHVSTFMEALERMDSCGLKYAEAYPGQKIGGEFSGSFGPSMSRVDRQKLKKIIHQKGIIIAAFGVIVTENASEWKKYFEFAKDLNIPLLTAEPETADLDLIEKLAIRYNIRVAIHDHPKPSKYWHPDSVWQAIKDHPHIGVCADIGHWVRNGLNVVECLQKVKGRVWDVHFKDVAEFGKKESPDTLLGTGVCNIPAVLRELKDQHFSGLFAIEHEVNWATNVNDVILNVRYYRQQLLQLQ